MLKFSTNYVKNEALLTAIEILKLLLNGSLLCSFALEFINPSYLQATGQPSFNDYKDILKAEFEKSWKQIGKSMQLNMEELSWFFHFCIDRLFVLKGKCKLHDSEDVMVYLRNLMIKIKNHFLQPSFHRELKHYRTEIATVRVRLILIFMRQELMRSLPIP